MTPQVKGQEGLHDVGVGHHSDQIPHLHVHKAQGHDQAVYNPKRL